MHIQPHRALDRNALLIASHFKWPLYPNEIIEDSLIKARHKDRPELHCPTNQADTTTHTIDDLYLISTHTPTRNSITERPGTI